MHIPKTGASDPCDLAEIGRAVSKESGEAQGADRSGFRVGETEKDGGIEDVEATSSAERKLLVESPLNDNGSCSSTSSRVPGRTSFRS